MDVFLQAEAAEAARRLAEEEARLEAERMARDLAAKEAARKAEEEAQEQVGYSCDTLHPKVIGALLGRTEAPGVFERCAHVHENCSVPNG